MIAGKICRTPLHKWKLTDLLFVFIIMKNVLAYLFITVSILD